MPLGRVHAEDLLHAFLLNALQNAGPLVEVRKYVDDTVLVAKGTHFSANLCQAYRRVHRSLSESHKPT
eukprot:1197160-Amphidinium_carterae.3